MRKIAIVVLALWLTTGCSKKERPPQDTPPDAPPAQKTEDDGFGSTFQDLVTALQGGDYDALDGYIGEALYVIFPGAGMYPDFVSHPSLTAASQDPNLREPMRYLLQAMSSQQGLSGTLRYEDLSALDPCEVKEITYLADETTTRVLTDTYKQLQENIGEEGQSPLFKRLLDAESSITMQVFVGTGEEADILYFAPSGKSWQLVALDLSECGM